MSVRQAIRAEFRARSRRFGVWTSLAHSSIAELLGGAGVDFIGLDLEHSTISDEQAQQLIIAAQAQGLACFPRVASQRGEQIRRMLDAGADGIIVPNVCTPGEVEQIVASAKYPPLGKRSYGVARAQRYGANFASYTGTWNERSTILIQIESVEGATAIDELLSHEAIDGVMIGPYDMSGSLGLPGQLTHPRVTRLCASVVEACARHEKACGTQIVEPTRERVAEAFEQGYTFVVLASDVFILWKWAERMRGLVEALRPRGRSSEAARVARVRP